MLIAILIVTLLVFIWGKFSEYQSSKDELANIENVAKFNEQFANYDRNNVQGYELISLINKIIDYNTKYSSATGNRNNEQYSPITITINIPDKTNDNKDLRKSFTVHRENNRLFGGASYAEDGVSVTAFQPVLELANECEEKYGGADNATRVAKNYINIFPESPSIQDKYNALRKFETLVLPSASSLYKLTNNNDTEIDSKFSLLKTNEEDDIYKYYEYMQFKRAYFRSTRIIYDNQSGRVVEMSFECTGFVKQQ